MRPKSRSRRSSNIDSAVKNPGRVIAAIAGRQRGVVSRGQLLAAGMEASAIKRRLRTSLLHPVHRGVYLVGHSTPMRGAREIAAVLACGKGAVISHCSAATLWNLLTYPADPPPVDITLAGRDAGRRAGIRIHWVRELDRRDLRTVDQIPVTAPPRTLLDLAAVVSSAELERAAAEAQVRRLVRRRDLVDQIERNRGRRGVRALRELMEARGAVATRSEAERRLLRLVRSAELPAPRANARLGRYEVDFLWREQRLVVEVDGYAYHAGRRAFERDRARDAALTVAGYTVLRVTWRQLVRTPQAVVAHLATALAAR